MKNMGYGGILYIVNEMMFIQVEKIIYQGEVK